MTEPPAASAPWLEVGRIVKAHGLGGEVVVHPITNVAGRFLPGTVLRLADDRVLTIRTSRPHQQRHLVRFEGVSDRNAAEALRGQVLRAQALAAPPTGELWVHELIGAEVSTLDGRPVGRVVSVVANPAHDLLELDTTLLVPMVFVRDHVAATADAPARVVIDPPDGLLDLVDGGAE